MNASDLPEPSGQPGTAQLAPRPIVDFCGGESAERVDESTGILEPLEENA